MNFVDSRLVYLDLKDLVNALLLISGLLIAVYLIAGVLITVRWIVGIFIVVYLITSLRIAVVCQLFEFAFEIDHVLALEKAAKLGVGYLLHDDNVLKFTE